jgi:hypothetical protein
VLPPSPPGGGANPPVAADDSALSSGLPVVITVDGNDSDVDGDLDPSTVTVVAQPLHGVVSCGSGSCTYGPVPGFNGIDTFTYMICDAAGACDTAVVMIFVASPAPTVVTPPTTGGGTGGGSGGGGSGTSGGSGGTGTGGTGTGGTGTGPGGTGGGGDEVEGRNDSVNQAPGNGSGPGSGTDTGTGIGIGTDNGLGGPGADPIGGGPGGDDPSLGAPGYPLLPFTGAGRIAFYLALAFNLVVLGGLVLLANSVKTRVRSIPVADLEVIVEPEPAPAAVEEAPAPARTSTKKTTVAKTVRYSKKTRRRPSTTR